MVVAVLASIFFIKPEILGVERVASQPDSFEYCIKQGTDQIVGDLAPTAGFLGAYFNKTYNNIAIPYVCYSDEYYKPCVVQAPFLEEKFKESFEARINSKVSQCYNNYVEEFRRQGYDVVEGDIEVTTELQKDKIKLDVVAPVSVSDGSNPITTQDLEFDIQTKIYDVIMLANNIVKFETTYGEYELVQSQLLYPDMVVTTAKLDDGTVVYTIRNREIKYLFAVRSYVNPPGYGI